MQLPYHSVHKWRVLSSYTGMTLTVQLHCPINAQIGPVDNQSDSRILLQFWLVLYHDSTVFQAKRKQNWRLLALIKMQILTPREVMYTYVETRNQIFVLQKI